MLYEEVVEVEGKVILSQEGICQLDKQGMKSVTPEKTLTGEGVHVFTDLDEQKLRKDLAGLLAKGVTSIAVALMHSYTYPDHELRIAQVCSKIAFFDQWFPPECRDDNFCQVSKLFFNQIFLDFKKF